MTKNERVCWLGISVSLDLLKTDFQNYIRETDNSNNFEQKEAILKDSNKHFLNVEKIVKSYIAANKDKFVNDLELD